MTPYYLTLLSPYIKPEVEKALREEHFRIMAQVKDAPMELQEWVSRLVYQTTR